MRVLINQEKLTLEIEKFLKRLKRERTKWYGFYSQLTNLLLGFNDIYDPDDEYTGYLKFFVILRYDLQRIDSDYFDLMDELKIIGYREMRAWFLDLSEDFEKDYKIRAYALSFFQSLWQKMIFIDYKTIYKFFDNRSK